MSQIPVSEAGDDSSIVEPKGQTNSSQEKSDVLDTSNVSLAVTMEVQAGRRKPWSFYLAFLALLLMVFLVSLDATTLAVAIPVCWILIHSIQQPWDILFKLYFS